MGYIHMRSLWIQERDRGLVLMATYEYQCKICSNVTQVERNMSDDEVLPLCCGELTTRIWQAAPIMFKGTGFYKTGG